MTNKILSLEETIDFLAKDAVDDYLSGCNDSRIPGISSISRIYGVQVDTLYVRIKARMDEKFRMTEKLRSQR